MKMLNPFIAYSLIWSMVVFLYELKYSFLYPNISMELYVFISFSILSSLLIGILYNSNIKKNIKNIKIENYNIKFPLYLIFLGNLIQILYVKGQVPIIQILTKTGSYTDFKGIKTFFTILMVYNSYISCMSFAIYNYTKKTIYIYIYIVLLSVNIIYYNRGGIMISLVIATLIFFSNKKISTVKIITLLILVLLILWGVGVAGNIRSKSEWNDSSKILYLGKISDEYPKNIPVEYFWSYIYITSPLGNLQKTLLEVEPNYNLNEYIVKNIIPDFLSKRLISLDNRTSYMDPSLNVSTMYISSAIIFNMLGLYITFIIYLLFKIIFIKLLKKNSIYYILGMAVLCAMEIFSFFSNMYVYSVVSFQLVFILLGCYKIKRKRIKFGIRSSF
ncbi:O-antigen polymerase [Cetobacterium sp.]|uniref:O-antigen polymerase n=1 Tax=Cetobacterium sp. TaxID=2071632 RepID=UPI003EE7215B